MPEANLPAFSLEGKSPAELEGRRRQIVAELQTYEGGYNDPHIPTSLLHELVAITSSLRRRNAGPPKAKKPAGTPSARATIDDL